MGSKFVTSVGFDLQEMYEESNNRKPLIFILSPGQLNTERTSGFLCDFSSVSSRMCGCDLMDLIAIVLR